MRGGGRGIFMINYLVINNTILTQAQNQYGWSLPSKIIIIKPLAHTEYNGRNAVN